MRPTVIRLIAGGALGVAFSVSLTLPGSVVFPDEPPIRQLAAPARPTATVLRAAPVVQRPRQAPTKPRVIVQRVYVPATGNAPATSAVRSTPPRSKPARKHIRRAPAPVGQPVTPLAARPAPPVAEPAGEPKQADEQHGDDEPRKADRPRRSEKPKTEKPKKAHGRRPDKPNKAKKPKEHGSPKKGRHSGGRKEDRQDQADDQHGQDKGEHGSGRGGRGDHG